MNTARTIILGLLAGLVAIAVLAMIRPVAPPPPEWKTFDDPSRLLTIRRAATTQIVDQTERALDRIVEDVNLDNVRLVDFMAYLAKESGVNVTADWNGLEAEGVKKESPVTVKLKHVPLRAVFRTVLRDLTNLNDGLTYRAKDNVIRIGPGGGPQSETFVRVYDVQDLLASQWIESAISAMPGLSAATPMNLPTVTEHADVLSKIIQETVDPTCWRDAGGSTGQIYYFNGRLVIKNL